MGETLGTKVGLKRLPGGENHVILSALSSYVPACDKRTNGQRDASPVVMSNFTII